MVNGSSRIRFFFPYRLKLFPPLLILSPTHNLDRRIKKITLLLAENLAYPWQVPELAAAVKLVNGICNACSKQKRNVARWAIYGDFGWSVRANCYGQPMTVLVQLPPALGSTISAISSAISRTRRVSAQRNIARVALNNDRMSVFANKCRFWLINVGNRHLVTDHKSLTIMASVTTINVQE